MRAQRITTGSGVPMRRETPPGGFSFAWLRASPDCVMLLNRAGRIGFLSDAGRRDLGIADLASVVGREWWTLWPEVQATAIRQGFDRAAAGEVVRFAAACPTADGAANRWKVMLTPVLNGEGEVESLLAVLREAPRADCG